MTLYRYRVRWWDSQEDDWQDVTLLVECEWDCYKYVSNKTPYMRRMRNIDGFEQDSYQAFFLSVVVLPYVLVYE